MSLRFVLEWFLIKIQQSIIKTMFLCFKIICNDFLKIIYKLKWFEFIYLSLYSKKWSGNVQSHKFSSYEICDYWYVQSKQGATSKPS